MFGLFKSRKSVPEIEPGSASEQSLSAVIPRSERYNSYKEVHVTTSTGYHTRGIVIDHSETGLRVRFQSMEALSDIIHIHVSGLNIRGTARVVWQDACDFGFEILDNQVH